MRVDVLTVARRLRRRKVFPALMDEKDHEIFQRLRIDGRSPAARIGDEVGLSADAVRARIARMTDDGVLRIIGVVDPSSLGYLCLGTLGLDYRGDVGQLVQTLRELSFVTFVALTLGEHNVICEIAAADDAELLERATSVVGGIAGVRGFEMWRLVDVLKWEGEGRPEATEVNHRRSPDELDAELLRLLVHDPRMTFRDLAERVRQPYSLVRRRAQALFDDGAIRASAVLDRSSAHAGTMGMLGLTLAGPQIGAALDFAVAQPKISIVVRSVGRFSATLEAVCDSPAELVRLADRISELPAVTGVSTYLYARSPVLPMPWLFRRVARP